MLKLTIGLAEISIKVAPIIISIQQVTRNTNEANVALCVNMFANISFAMSMLCLQIDVLPKGAKNQLKQV